MNAARYSITQTPIDSRLSGPGSKLAALAAPMYDQTAAAGVFHGSVLAYGFPLLVDALILGASMQYVAGARAHTSTFMPNALP